MTNDKRRTLSGWLIANPIFLLTIAVAAFYAAVRYGQNKFYSRLGLAPEDVGLNRIDTLTQATGLAIDLLLLVAIMIGFPMLGYWWYRRVDSSPSGLTTALWIAALLLIAGGTAFFEVVWFSEQATWAANRVEAGKSVRLSFLSDTGIHAERARIAWIGAAPKGLADLGTHRLMFMGQSGGAVVLYDVDDKESIRVPSSTLAVSISP
jgi:hypothetical protein